MGPCWHTRMLPIDLCMHTRMLPIDPCWHTRILPIDRGGNNSKISGSQQDCLVEKSGSPERYLAVLKMAQIFLKQNNTTNNLFKSNEFNTKGEHQTHSYPCTNKIYTPTPET